jgi:hypothetical protein
MAVVQSEEGGVKLEKQWKGEDLLRRSQSNSGREKKRTRTYLYYFVVKNSPVHSRYCGSAPTPLIQQIFNIIADI